MTNNLRQPSPTPADEAVDNPASWAEQLHRPRAPWTPAAPPADYVLGHVQAVLPDRVIDDARIVVRDGLIAAVEPHPAGFAADVDGQGLLCVPGIVDTHSDGLELERLPRPNAEVPVEFALVSFEGKLRAAGVTTVFHGVGFEERSKGRGLPRTVRQAVDVCESIDAFDGELADHRILYRLDVRSPEGLAALQKRIDTIPTGALVSHEDHTPGQGQFTDLDQYKQHLTGPIGMSDTDAQELIQELIETRDGRQNIRDQAFSWFTSRPGLIRLLGHDPSSAGEIAELVERGAAAAEFPTTVEAAQAANDHGLPVIVGAPNIMRGRSHNGNASGRELIGKGLVTAVASDYLPSGLLASALLLARTEILTLPAAIALITSGPAEVAGLTDRGQLSAQSRADLVLVEPRGQWPVVKSVLRSPVERTPA